MADAEFSTDAVAYAAAARPAKTAVVALADDARLSYAALSELANRAAGWLAARLGGAPEGQRLAYLGRNGVELLVLALGAERCGAIFVPVNWRLAGAEIAALLEDCTPAVVVAQDEFLPLLREGVAVTEVLAPICATPA